MNWPDAEALVVLMVDISVFDAAARVGSVRLSRSRRRHRDMGRAPDAGNARFDRVWCKQPGHRPKPQRQQHARR
ncbi:hypothetical protein GCM10008179_02680 [Hansschlegelia plantiphila]|uniref:Uncharacterized protein n=1 Tax=Hansschlegelia plantiphila TaxID=374655 RepID=A0A9W6IWW4_9HYPH|nr:hypothetical protein GCM10008179_02680 [Hansschlegelia plantiphila]